MGGVAEELTGWKKKKKPTLPLNGCLLMLTRVTCLFINWEGKKGFYHPFVVRYTAFCTAKAKNSLILPSSHDYDLIMGGGGNQYR